MLDLNATVRRYRRGRLPNTDVDAACSWAEEAANAHLYSPFGFPAVWRVHQDDDGAILLLPTDDVPEPGFAITTAAGGAYVVLVCDPDEQDEIGPFRTVGDALAGISRWLALPTASRAASCSGQLALSNA